MLFCASTVPQVCQDCAKIQTVEEAIITTRPIRFTESHFTFIGTRDSIFLMSLYGLPRGSCGPPETHDPSILNSNWGHVGTGVPVEFSSQVLRLSWLNVQSGRQHNIEPTIASALLQIKRGCTDYLLFCGVRKNLVIDTIVNILRCIFCGVGLAALLNNCFEVRIHPASN